MTYPQQPGQPGQPGWGHQPPTGPGGQQPHQPNWGQQSPPQGPAPGQPPHQQGGQPPFGAPQQPGQPGPQNLGYQPGTPGQAGHPGMGQPGPGGFGGPQQKKSKTGLIIGVAGGAVALALVAAFTLYFIFAGGSDSRSVAEQYFATTKRLYTETDALTPEDFQPVVCGKLMNELNSSLERQKASFRMAPPEQQDKLRSAEWRITDVIEEGDHGRVNFEIHAPGEEPIRGRYFLLTKENDEWKVCIP